MPGNADNKLTWHLGSVPNFVPPGEQWTVNIYEPISDEEYASHQGSVGFLYEIFSGSSFGGFQRNYNGFKDVTEGVAQAFETKKLTPQMVQEIGTKIDDVLTALRRFADRTAHSSSQRYGKDSQEYKALSRHYLMSSTVCFPTVSHGIFVTIATTEGLSRFR
jgi:hypothetical protein